MNKYWYFLLICLLSTPLKSQDLYAVEQIQTVKLYIDVPNWDNRLNAYKKQGLDKRLAAKLVLNGVTYDSVGVRYKGNSSYFNTRKENTSKLPFNIKINYTNKNQVLQGGFKRLKLSNVFRDPSFLREVLSYEIAGNYMPAPKANFAKVYVNDEYLGLYNSAESIDKHFLAERFGEEDGVLFKCDPVWKAKNIAGCKPNPKSTLVYMAKDSTCYTNAYELKTKTGWPQLINLTDILNNKTENIETILNVDQVLWMLAFNNVLVNLDSYTGRLVHNYYLYQDINGIFNPIIWDLNMSFGGFRFDGTGKALSNEEMQTLSPFIHYKTKNPDRPLITLLLKKPLYRKVYLAHMQTILNDHFSNGKYKERAKYVQHLVDTEVKNDTNKLYPYEGFQTNLDATTLAKTSKIIGITELMDKRVEYLTKHPVFSKTPPVIAEVEHQLDAEGIFITAKITGNEGREGKKQPAYLVYRNDRNGAWQKVEMFDDGSHKDYSQDDLIYAATIPEVPNTEYYIIAEGERMAALSPARASFEFYEVR